MENHRKELLSLVFVAGFVGCGSGPTEPVYYSTGLLHEGEVAPEPSLSWTWRAALAPVRYDRAEYDPRLEMVLVNNSDLDLENIAIVPQGQAPMRSFLEIATGLKRATDKETAFAVYEFVRSARYHDYAPTSRGQYPPAFLLGTGYGPCGDSAFAVHHLTLALGIRSRVVYLDGHVVAEVFYAGAFHMFDPDHEVYYFHAGEVASVEILERTDIVARSGDAARRDPLGVTVRRMAKIYAPTNRSYDDQRFAASFRPFPLRIAHRETLVFRRAHDGDGYYSEYTPPVRPPLYYVADGTREVALTARSDGSMVIEVPWSPYLILGAAVGLPKVSAEGAERIVMCIAAPLSGCTMSIRPTVAATPSGVQLSFTPQDLGRLAALQKMRLLLIFPTGTLPPGQAQLTVTRQIGPGQLPRLDGGENRFDLLFETSGDGRAVAGKLGFALRLPPEPDDGLRPSWHGGMSIDHPVVPADGNRFAWVTVSLRDRDGLPLAHRPVVAASDRSGDIIETALPVVITGNWTEDLVEIVLVDAREPRGLTDEQGKIVFRVRSLAPGVARLSFRLPLEGNQTFNRRVITFIK